MPPEQAPFLVILDVSRGSAGVTGTVEYVQPENNTLRVRWGVGSPPPGYVAKGGGVVFVSGAKSAPKPPDEAPNINLRGDQFTYSEGFDGAGWLMLVMVLPQGEELTDVTPPPAGSRLHGDRLAAYWRLAPGPSTPPVAEVSWRFRRIANLGDALTESRVRHALPFDPEERDPKFQLFLSYRKKDDRWAVGQIHRLLTQHLGKNAVFRDVDSIRLGNDFRTSIDNAVGRCRILLAVIGPYWLDPDKPLGQRRVDSIDDWPRVEIESALQRHKLVVPVLLDDTQMPHDSLLPDSLQELPYLQGIALREASFNSDIETLAKQVRVILDEDAH
jgi:hypothetical protein